MIVATVTGILSIMIDIEIDRLSFYSMYLQHYIQSDYDVFLPLLSHLSQLPLIRLQPLRDPIFKRQLASLGAIISKVTTVRRRKGRLTGLYQSISSFPQ
jgi:hypothetical protein